MPHATQQDHSQTHQRPHSAQDSWAKCSAPLLPEGCAGLCPRGRWHSRIWVRYMASVLCPELGCEHKTPGSGAFQASSGITGAGSPCRKGHVAQQANRDQRSRPLSGRPHQALPTPPGHRHFLVLSHFPDHTLCRDNNLPPPLCCLAPLPLPPSPSFPSPHQVPHCPSAGKPSALPWGGYCG